MNCSCSKKDHRPGQPDRAEGAEPGGEPDPEGVEPAVPEAPGGAQRQEEQDQVHRRAGGRPNAREALHEQQRDTGT